MCNSDIPLSKTLVLHRRTPALRRSPLTGKSSSRAAPAEKGVSSSSNSFFDMKNSL